jgi:hypothetical protein
MSGRRRPRLGSARTAIPASASTRRWFERPWHYARGGRAS